MKRRQEETIEPLLIGEDNEKIKQVKVMMVGREEFIKVEEQKHIEVASISELEGTKTTSLKNDFILEGNDLELVSIFDLL